MKNSKRGRTINVRHITKAVLAARVAKLEEIERVLRAESVAAQGKIRTLESSYDSLQRSIGPLREQAAFVDTLRSRNEQLETMLRRRPDSAAAEGAHAHAMAAAAREHQARESGFDLSLRMARQQYEVLLRNYVRVLESMSGVDGLEGR